MPEIGETTVRSPLMGMYITYEWNGNSWVWVGTSYEDPDDDELEDVADAGD